jgi:UMF1 family MFS transporter
VWPFLWASFFSANAISTVLIFMAVYTKRVAGFTEPEVIRFFLFGQAFAVAGALAGGRLIPRWGARRSLAVIWAGWLAGLALIAWQIDVRWLWVAGPVIGFCLGPTWATSRVLLIELAPKERLGELLGLAGVVARASGILGPIVWGLLVWDPARSQVAVVAMMLLLVTGLVLLRRVPDTVGAGG